MLGKKAQVSAPFELMVAVILMTFVILAGLYAMNTLEKQKCENEVNKELEELKEAIELIAKGKGQHLVSFELPGCAQRNTEVKIVTHTDPYLCNILCGGSKTVCIVLTFDAEGVSSMVKCLEISPLTQFAPDSCACPEDDYNLAKGWQTGNIQQGTYLITSGYAVGGGTPIVCPCIKVEG